MHIKLAFLLFLLIQLLYNEIKKQYWIGMLCLECRGCVIQDPPGSCAGDEVVHIVYNYVIATHHYNIILSARNG